MLKRYIEDVIAEVKQREAPLAMALPAHSGTMT